MSRHRLRDVLWDNYRLYLIMDYVELDLREHMDQNPESSDLDNVKVSMRKHAIVLNH